VRVSDVLSSTIAGIKITVERPLNQKRKMLLDSLRYDGVGETVVVKQALPPAMDGWGFGFSKSYNLAYQSNRFLFFCQHCYQRERINIATISVSQEQRLNAAGLKLAALRTQLKQSACWVRKHYPWTEHKGDSWNYGQQILQGIFLGTVDIVWLG
jgi:hypothetical protein